MNFDIELVGIDYGADDATASQRFKYRILHAEAKPEIFQFAFEREAVVNVTNSGRVNLHFFSEDLIETAFIGEKTCAEAFGNDEVAA